MSATAEKAAVGFRTASEIAKERGISPFRYAEETDPAVTASLVVRAEVERLRSNLKLVLGAHGDYREGKNPDYLCECGSCEEARRALDEARP